MVWRAVLRGWRTPPPPPPTTLLPPPPVASYWQSQPCAQLEFSSLRAYQLTSLQVYDSQKLFLEFGPQPPPPPHINPLTSPSLQSPALCIFQDVRAPCSQRPPPTAPPLHLPPSVPPPLRAAFTSRPFNEAKASLTKTWLATDKASWSFESNSPDVSRLCY